MGKTLRELSTDLVEFIINMHNNAHDSGSFHKQRYNNLKLEMADPRLYKTPQIKIHVGISEAVFDLANLQKISGSLGPDERYVMRWLSKDTVINELNEMWKNAEQQVGKAYDDKQT